MISIPNLLITLSILIYWIYVLSIAVTDTFYILNFLIVLYLGFLFNKQTFYWKKERQEGNYYVTKLFKGFKFEGHLIKIPKDSYIPKHIGKLKETKHIYHRINCIVPTGYRGGKHLNEWNKPLSEKLIYYFNPDRIQHSVSPVTQGTQYILSIGWRTKQ